MGYDSVGKMDTLDDLWEIDRSKWLWAWMGGSNAALEFNRVPGYDDYRVASDQTWPGARMRAKAWTDRNGDVWLFGGANETPSLYTFWYNDLFEYTIP